MMPWYLGCQYECRLCEEVTFHSSLDLILHVKDTHNTALGFYVQLFKSKTFETKIEYFTCKLCDKEGIKKCYEEIYAHLLSNHNLNICDYENVKQENSHGNELNPLNVLDTNDDEPIEELHELEKFADLNDNVKIAEIRTSEPNDKKRHRVESPGNEDFENLDILMTGTSEKIEGKVTNNKSSKVLIKKDIEPTDKNLNRKENYSCNRNLKRKESESSEKDIPMNKKVKDPDACSCSNGFYIKDIRYALKVFSGPPGKCGVCTKNCPKVLNESQIQEFLQTDYHDNAYYLTSQIIAGLGYYGLLQLRHIRNLTFGNIRIRETDGSMEITTNSKETGLITPTSFSVTIPNKINSVYSFPKAFQNYKEVLKRQVGEEAIQKNSYVIKNVYNSGQKSFPITRENVMVGNDIIGNCGKRVARILGLKDWYLFSPFTFVFSRAAMKAKQIKSSNYKFIN